LPAFLESTYVRFEFPGDGSYQAVDEVSSVPRRSSPLAKRLGSATTEVSGQLVHLSLDKYEVSRRELQEVWLGCLCPRL